MELWDVYTADRRPTGRTVRRGVDALGPGEYHISVHVVLLDSHGRILLQRRSMDKKDWPGIWDIAAAAGNVLAGEDSSAAAQRELMEELGLSLPVAGTAPRMTLTLDEAGCFGDWYVLHCDAPIAAMRFQPGEVMDACWADPRQALEMIADGRMVDYHPGFVSMLTDLDGGRGAMRSWRGRWQK